MIRQWVSHLGKKGWRKGAAPLFGCVGYGLGLAPKAACQTDSLQGILRLIYPWNLLKGDVFISDFAFSWATCTHAFRLEKAALLMSLFAVVPCGIFHLGYCKVWLSVELSDELLSLYSCYSCLWISIVYCSWREHFNKVPAQIGKSTELPILSWTGCTLCG